jgi:hypothetical protein
MTLPLFGFFLIENGFSILGGGEVGDGVDRGVDFEWQAPSRITEKIVIMNLCSDTSSPRGNPLHCECHGCATIQRHLQ